MKLSNFFPILALLAGYLPSHAVLASQDGAIAPVAYNSTFLGAEFLSKFTSCKDYWDSFRGNGSDEMVYTCSNGKDYVLRGALCSYVSKGLIFDSLEEHSIYLLCEKSRLGMSDPIRQCLADNIKNAAEIDMCQSEVDDLHSRHIHAR